LTSENPPAARLALVEVLDRDGRVRLAAPVTAWPFTIGRAIDNDLVLDDPHVAERHLSFDAAEDGRIVLRLAPTRNGATLGRERLAGASERELPPTGAGRPARPDLVLGTTRVRLRLAADALEPERDLPRRARVGLTLVLALVLWGWLVAEYAIQADPGGSATEWLRPVLMPPVALVVWCIAWALASKLFQHRFDFWPHLAVAVPGVLAAEATGFVLPWLSAVFGWPGFSRLTIGAIAAVAVVWLLQHARLVLPQQRRALAFTAVGAYLAGVAIVFTLNQQRYERWFAELYSARLPPPGLAWHRAASREEFVGASASLEAALQRRVDEAAAQEKASGEEEE
jgi:hypothetical protein